MSVPPKLWSTATEPSPANVICDTAVRISSLLSVAAVSIAAKDDASAAVVAIAEAVAIVDEEGGESIAPVVGAEAQPPHALGDAGATGAHDHAEAGELRADPLQVVPGLRAEDREVDDDGAQAHGDERLHGNGAGEDPVFAPETLEALPEHLDETGVGVDHREAQRVLGVS